MNDFLITTIKYKNEELPIYFTDFWLIQQIRKIGYGVLSEVKIQDGRVVIVGKKEQKIKPLILED